MEAQKMKLNEVNLNSPVKWSGRYTPGHEPP